MYELKHTYYDLLAHAPEATLDSAVSTLLRILAKDVQNGFYRVYTLNRVEEGSAPGCGEALELLTAVVLPFVDRIYDMSTFRGVATYEHVAVPAVDGEHGEYCKHREQSKHGKGSLVPCELQVYDLQLSSSPNGADNSNSRLQPYLSWESWHSGIREVVGNHLEAGSASTVVFYDYTDTTRQDCECCPYDFRGMVPRILITFNELDVRAMAHSVDSTNTWLWRHICAVRPHFVEAEAEAVGTVGTFSYA
ncbi:MAG: hypothetical protein M3441_04150 [Chloroflexota bacterium]|nr:hypothetical protein [Chloroflexota bacterium]